MLSSSSAASNSTKRRRPRTVKLVISGHHRSPAAAVDFPFSSDDDGVDLGAIGSCFGLDPTTVRLNGHFLSRGPRLVSSLTWASLLSFFSARGFPAGASHRDPIVVHGKPLAAGATATATATASGLHCGLDLEDDDHLSFKMKIRLEDERPVKKNRVSVNNSNAGKIENGVVSDDESICIRRRLRLDDNQPAKKLKISHCNPGLVSGAPKLPGVPQQDGTPYNGTYALEKRLREEEMVVPVSCKRIK